MWVNTESRPATFSLTLSLSLSTPPPQTLQHDSLPGTMSANQTYIHWGSSTAKPDPGSLCNDTQCMTLEDYTRRLDDGMAASNAVLEAALGRLAGGPVALAQSGRDDEVVVFNPLAEARTELVSAELPAELAAGVAVTVEAAATGQAVEAQLGPGVGGPLSAVYFEASIPGLGLAVFRLVKGGSRPAAKPSTGDGPLATLDNGLVAAALGADGRLAGLSASGVGRVEVAQEAIMYHGALGGPYCLVETQAAKAVPLATGSGAVTHVSGPVYCEVTVRDEVATTTYRLARSAAALDVVHEIGQLPLGTEYASRLHLGWHTGGRLLTDDSGLELHERRLNTSMPISGSYHAMVQSTVVRSGAGAAQLSVLTRHTVGVASLADGQLEYMMMRNLNSSDNQGPWPLRQEGDLEVAMRLLLAANDKSRMVEALRHENPLVVGYGSAAGRVGAQPLGGWVGGGEGVYLMSYYVRGGAGEEEEEESAGEEGRQVVVRLQNVVEGSAAVTTRLPVAEGMKVTGCREVTLSLLQDREGGEGGDCSVDMDVVLGPIDIRTFVLDVE